MAKHLTISKEFFIFYFIAVILFLCFCCGVIWLCRRKKQSKHAMPLVGISQNNVDGYYNNDINGHVLPDSGTGYITASRQHNIHATNFNRTAPDTTSNQDEPVSIQNVDSKSLSNGNVGILPKRGSYGNTSQLGLSVARQLSFNNGSLSNTVGHLSQPASREQTPSNTQPSEMDVLPEYTRSIDEIFERKV